MRNVQYMVQFDDVLVSMWNWLLFTFNVAVISTIFTYLASYVNIYSKVKKNTGSVWENLLLFILNLKNHQSSKQFNSSPLCTWLFTVVVKCKKVSLSLPSYHKLAARLSSVKGFPLSKVGFPLSKALYLSNLHWSWHKHW